MNDGQHLIKPESWVHTGVIRLKDGDHQRGVFVDLVKTFGFIPRYIAISKVQGQNNRFIVSAEKTPEVLAYEKQQIESLIPQTILKPENSGPTAPAEEPDHSSKNEPEQKPE